MSTTWPLPALVAWASAWLVFRALAFVGAEPWMGVAAAIVLSALVASRERGVRRALVLLGFPLSLLLLGQGGVVAPWAWLGIAIALLVIYPVRAWRDAPVFPTDAAALAGLARELCLPPGAPILDAGCGLGHGLAALRAEWPDAAFEGVERSLPLSMAARWRCPYADISAGDMWAMSWSRFQMVYLFQRPETMSRAWAKACADMRPGSWFLSLEFAVPDAKPFRVHQVSGRRAVWIYRVPRAQPSMSANR